MYSTIFFIFSINYFSNIFTISRKILRFFMYLLLNKQIYYKCLIKLSGIHSTIYNNSYNIMQTFYKLMTKNVKTLKTRYKK